MRERFKYTVRCILYACFIMLAGRNGLASSATNIILFIGDGMGLEHVKAGRYFIGADLCFEAWTNARIITDSASAPLVTDSAAGATAIATGVDVYNGVISIADPGDKSDLETILEYFKGKGKRTGLVTTTIITHATPAGFGAHVTNRNYYAGIASDYLNQTKPNILFGGGGYGMSVGAAESAGYTVVTNRSQMTGLNLESETMVSGQFGPSNLPYEYDGLGSLPHLSEMTETALQILDNGDSGFFLMVEGGLIDPAAHGNDITRCVREIAEFDNAVQKAINWVSSRTDTIILVTADHETGGLNVLADNGAGNNPTVSWSSGGHTAVHVGIWAWGPKEEQITGIMENNEIFTFMLNSYFLETSAKNIIITTNSVQTGWTARTGDVYRLEMSEDLINTNWTVVGVATALSDAVTIIDTNMTGSSGFYRLMSTR